MTCNVTRLQLEQNLKKGNQKRLLYLLAKLQRDDGLYDMTLLEEDGSGNVPGDSNFNYNYITIFQRLAEKGHKAVINHPAIVALIDFKWKNWAKRKFILNFCLYLLGLFSLTFSATVAVGTTDVNIYDSRLHHARAFFELVAYLLVIKATIHEVLQCIRHGLQYCKQLLNWLEIVSAVILLLVLPLRLAHTTVHWYIFALGYLLWLIKIFKYALVFSQTGAYAESLRQILWKNFLPFSVLFCIINLAFGGTFLLVLKGDGSLDTHTETSTLWGIWYVGLRTLIEAQPVVEYTGSEGYRTVGTIVMLIFMAMTTVVLLNILIAQLSETYHSIQRDARKSVLVNRAWIVARLERNILPCPSLCCLEKNQRKRAFKRNILGGIVKTQKVLRAQMNQIYTALDIIEDLVEDTDSGDDIKTITVHGRPYNVDESLEWNRFNTYCSIGMTSVDTELSELSATTSNI